MRACPTVRPNPPFQPLASCVFIVEGWVRKIAHGTAPQNGTISTYRRYYVKVIIAPGGIVVLDDLSLPSVRSVCRYVLSSLRYQCIGPQSRELPERTASRNLLSRARQHGIGALMKAPRSRILAPAWRILLRRVNKLVPLHRVFTSKVSADSQLNILDYSNHIALQKLADGHWAHNERPLSSSVILVDFSWDHCQT
jgi:hypothetical protein